MTKKDAVAFVAVDVETTGFTVGRDHIYEIAIVSFDHEGREIDSFESVCRPRVEELSKRLIVLEDAPTFEQIAGDVIRHLREGVVVGHNVTFDLAMIDAGLERVGAGLGEVPFVDTIDLVMGLRVDTPNRALSTLCHVLGVEEGAFHSAGFDARAAAEVFTRLRARMMTEHGLDPLGAPSMFRGSSVDWPELVAQVAPLPRDLDLLPPAPRRRDTELFTSGPGISVALPGDTLLSPELSKKIAETTVLMARRSAGELDLKSLPGEITTALGALDSEDLSVSYPAARVLLDWCRDPSGELVAAESDFAASDFRGLEGVVRLEWIVEVFTRFDDAELSDALLALARLKRYLPDFDHQVVQGAYRSAFDASLAEAREEQDDEDDDDHEYEQPAEVLADLLGYLLASGSVTEVIKLISEFPDPRWGLIDTDLAIYVHRPRVNKEFARAYEAAAELDAFYERTNQPLPGAGVYAEWAQALDEEGRRLEAIELCERVWGRGWVNDDLVDRHSLLLERDERFADAAEVLGRWLASHKGTPRLRERLDRCNCHLGIEIPEPAQSVCFTGNIIIDGNYQRADRLEEMALGAGWRVVSSVTKKGCTLLVASTDLGPTSKELKARQFGIAVVDGDEFARMVTTSEDRQKALRCD